MLYQVPPQTNSIASQNEAARHYAVYLFRARADKDSDGYKPRHLIWQRDFVTPTMEAALTRAAMARTETDVKRVQIFELTSAPNEATPRTGRIVKTFGGSGLRHFWESIFQRA